MITKHDNVRQQTYADTTIADVIRAALADNYARIPLSGRRIGPTGAEKVWKKLEEIGAV